MIVLDFSALFGLFLGFFLGLVGFENLLILPRMFHHIFETGAPKKSTDHTSDDHGSNKPSPFIR